MDSSKHRVKLIEILKDIYDDPQLRTSLGFKGGTAAMLYYELPRFSMDLDFDLLKEGIEDEVFQKVQAILEKHGELREARTKRFTIFFQLSYEKSGHTIKVEISRRATSAQFEPKSYLGIPMLVMKQADMAASKLSAIITRPKPAMRDIFDTWFFLRGHWPVNETLFEEKTRLGFEEGIRKIIKQVEAVKRNQILQGLGDLVNRSQKDWVRDKLVEETVFGLRLLLEGRK